LRKKQLTTKANIIIVKINNLRIANKIVITKIIFINYYFNSFLLFVIAIIIFILIKVEFKFVFLLFKFKLLLIFLLIIAILTIFVFIIVLIVFKTIVF